VFFSKIWFFLIALVAAVGLTIALVMPRPAARNHGNEEKQRLVVACTVIDILLGDDARNRVELASAFGRKTEVVAALDAAGGVALDETRMKQVRSLATNIIEEEMKGARKPDFAVLIDKRGRVVARVALDENEFGDVAAGRPLVDDALAGYVRDDLWAHNGTLYLVTAAPVVKRETQAYAGAIVIGHQVTNALAQRLVKSLDVDVGFYLGKDEVAGSKTLAVETSPLLDAVKRLSGGEISQDCLANKSFPIIAGKESYTALVARLPGEVSTRQAYYGVFIKRPAALGFVGTLEAVEQGDLAPSSFPWIFVGGGFLVMLGIGIALMFIESDRPLRRLAAESVKLGKGEAERLSEDAHPGKYGSIARSVNIAIDKLGREAKTAKKDMDQLLGPSPEGSLGTIDLLATALPAVRPGGAPSAGSPPPSEFKFHSASTQPGLAAPPPRPAPAPPSARPGTPPPFAATPSSRPVAPPPPPLGIPTPAPSFAAATAPPSALGLDDDILGGAGSDPASAPDVGGGGDDYFKQVFDQFIAMKKSCGEPVAGLTLAKFSEKLVKNRDDLMSKTGCRDVRFTVYVKDGKAALKATPVKDD